MHFFYLFFNSQTINQLIFLFYIFYYKIKCNNFYDIIYKISKHEKSVDLLFGHYRRNKKKMYFTKIYFYKNIHNSHLSYWIKLTNIIYYAITWTFTCTKLDHEWIKNNNT